MKMTVEFDCTPGEARAFLGLPDVAPLNDHLVDEMRKRLDANVGLLDPEALMRSWMDKVEVLPGKDGGQAQEKFRSLMAMATTTTAGRARGSDPG